MARFITTESCPREGALIINTDYIEMVRCIGDHALEITMTSGNIITVSSLYWRKICGEHVIRQAIPVKNVVASFEPGDADAYECPVHALVVTEEGDLRPVDIEDTYVAFMDEYRGYSGIRVDGEIVSGGKDK